MNLIRPARSVTHTPTDGKERRMRAGRTGTEESHVKSFPNPFTREFWIDDSEVRRELGRVPEAGVKAMQQARLSAIALENDREQLRQDLERRLRQNKEQRERIEAALDELDALRILEKAS